MTDDEIYESNLKHFQVIKKYDNRAQCVCPAHRDRQASLTVTKGRKCTLLYCHAGCQLDDILNAAGLEKKDIFYETLQSTANWRTFIEKRENNKIEAVYNYVSLNGSYAFTKIRLSGKKILYGRLENERFTYGLSRNKPRKSYRAIYGDLKAIKKAIDKDIPIFITEGEKDTDTMVKQGYVAFTYGSCSDWQADFAELVKGAQVIILADNDKPGIEVANKIHGDIKDVTKSVKIVVPMPDVPKADITDYFESGKTRADFEALVSADKHNINVTKSNKLDLMQFHLIADNGKITGVFHAAIFEFIKRSYDIFVCGGTPYIYDNGYFKADVSGARLKSIIRSMIYPKFIKSTTINNIYALFLQDIELEVAFDSLNDYPAQWICFKNGMYDAISGKMIPHNPKYKAVNQIPHKYEPSAVYKGKNIDDYLDFICDEDSKEMLLQFMGYCLTKDVGQQKFLVLNGEGGTGKSTVIRLMEALTGSNNVSNISLTDLSQRFASFGLMGKLLNSCADLEIQALEDTSIIKKILGEDTLRAEQKGKDAVSFKSYAKLVFSTNELPLVKSEKTDGFYRRLLVLTMNKKPLQKNPNLFNDLSNEIDYLLHLAVQALERMYKQRIITVSKASELAVLQLRADSDTTEAFLQEYCKEDVKGRIERTAIYNKYIAFCDDTERQSLTKNNFYKAMRVKGYLEIKSNGYRFFKGIKYKEKCSNNAPESALGDFKNVTQDDIESLPFD